MRVAFGDCVLDTDSRTLWRGGAPVHLSPKAYELLLALVEARPRALSRAELQDRLWPQAFVGHTSLPRVLAEVRDATGDDARVPRYVRTVHSFGYAFCAEARGPAASPGALVWGAEEIPLAEGDNDIGRSRTCAAVVDAPGVSRHHARVHLRDGIATVEDLGSRNGTWLGGRRVVGRERLADGDEITLGTSVALVLRLATPEELTATDAPA